LAWRVKPVLLVLAEIVGLAPEKVKAEAPRVSVLMVPEVTAPLPATVKLVKVMEELDPPAIATVPLALPMLTVPL
jgi:hypothetical protein